MTVVAMATILALLAGAQDGPVCFPFEEGIGRLRSAHTGVGEPPVWEVIDDASAPSGRKVLVSSKPDPAEYRFAMAVADLRSSSGVLWVRFKPLGGKVDQAGGLVWRYRDSRNYYVARANALEGNLRLYKVVDGRRIQLATADTPIAAGEWHTLVVLFDRNRYVARLNGGVAVTVEDETFPEAGAIGVWTKSDSVTSFDDLTFVPSNHICAAGLFDPSRGFESGVFEADPGWHALICLSDPRAGFYPCRKLAARAGGNDLLADLESPARLRERLQEASDWPCRVVRGGLALRFGDRKQAASEFEAVLRERPVCLEALLGRARANRSLSDALLATALHPESERARIAAAQLLAAAGRIQEARAQLNAVPNSVGLLLARASLELLEGRPARAGELLDQALNIDPDDPRILYNRSLAWEQQGNHDRAMEKARRAAELAPELPDPRHQIGRLYTRQFDYESAEAEFRRAVEIDPRYAKSWVGLGWVEAHRARYDAAIEMYTRALELDDSIAEAWALRGNAHWKSGRTSESIADYTRAIDRNPKLALAWANRGMARVAVREFAAALKDLEEALRLDPRLRPALQEYLDKAHESLREY